MPSRPHDTFETPDDVQTQIVDIHFAHQRAQRAFELANFSGRRMDRDAVVVEPLASVVVVALIAEHAVHIFGNQYVKAFSFGGLHKPLVAGAVDDRRARNGAIIEDRNNRQPFTLTKLAAQFNLIFD